MSQPSPPTEAPAAAAPRSRILAWALWDFGATAVNAIVITFVFSVYLTSTVGEGLPGPTSPASWLGRALAAAGLLVAVLAPAAYDGDLAARATLVSAALVMYFTRNALAAMAAGVAAAMVVRHFLAV